MVYIYDMSENNLLENSKAQMRKGILEFCILLIIARDRVYASEILNELYKADMIVVEGTLYPLLSRLKSQGYLHHSWEESKSGPPRKYYTLTDKGKEFLKEMKSTWSELTKSIKSLINMKKALQITIAGTLFTIEEDAYQALDHYLQSIKKYFSTYPDNTEILQDIEARIAERLNEHIKNTHSIVTSEGVQAVIAAMGTVEDFAKASGVSSESAEQKKEEPSAGQSYKKLYRNPDDVVIAGVASGFASFFGIDPLAVRILFIVLTVITSGAFAMIYIILALIMPEADTPAEKMQMKGGPMTLDSFRETVNKNTKQLMSEDSSVRKFLTKIFSVFGLIVRGAIKVLLAIVGIALLIGAVVAIVSISFAFINLTLNIHSPYVEFPLAQVLNGPVYYLLVILGYILVVVPLVFLTVIGLSFIRRRLWLNGRSALGLGALWVVALLIAGTLSVRYLPDIQEKISALPQYQVTTNNEKNLQNFNKLELHGIDVVHLKQDDAYSIAEQGRQIDIDRVQFEVRDDTLILTQKSRGRLCFFCLGRDRLTITIAMPTLSSIETGGAISLTSDPLGVESLSLTTSGISTADVHVTGKTVVVEEDGASQVTLHGTSPVIKVSTSGVSRFNGKDFRVRVGTVDASGSSKIIINATETLEAIASGVSDISYYSTPKVSHDASGQAHIRSATEN
jgi:DNA-binding PadR family transcriptional regulator/phage shock protein PspC (stress-responsive transcriptional regulator)